MMKSRFLFLVALFSLMAVISCSDDDDDSPFLGKWQLMSIEAVSYNEDGSTDTTITDCRSENKFITFLSNGRMDFEVKTKYSYNDHYMFYYYPSTHATDTYEYSFGNGNNTLKLKLKKKDTGDIIYIMDSSLYGKTQVYRRVK